MTPSRGRKLKIRICTIITIVKYTEKQYKNIFYKNLFRLRVDAEILTKNLFRFVHIFQTSLQVSFIPKP